LGNLAYYLQKFTASNQSPNRPKRKRRTPLRASIAVRAQHGAIAYARKPPPAFEAVKGGLLRGNFDLFPLSASAVRQSGANFRTASSTMNITENQQGI